MRYELRIVALTKCWNGGLSVYTYKQPDPGHLVCAAYIAHCLDAAGIEYQEVNVEGSNDSDRLYVAIK
jgi:hypothetical protein